MTLVRVDDPTKTIRLTGDLRRRYEVLMELLGDRLDPIQDALADMIDGDRIHTAGWMPGRDWTGTPFQAIYEVCGGDEDEAGRVFGLMVWMMFENHPDTWASAHGMIDGREIRSRTYFRWPGEES